MTRPLYEISSALASVLAEVDEAEGVLEGTLEERLDAASGELGEKVEAVAAFIIGLDHQAEAEAAEEERFAARKKATKAKAARLRAYLVSNLSVAGQPKVVGRLFTVSVKKNPHAMRLLVDADLVPEAWTVLVPAERKPDNAAIKAALKNGTDLPFAELTQSESAVIK